MTTLVHRIMLVALLGLTVVCASCMSIVGDDCTNDIDCGTGLICDASLPDGYCTRKNCLVDGCPDEGVCVTFDEDTANCMKPCVSDSDCRTDFVCIADFGPHAFCNVPITNQD